MRTPLLSLLLFTLLPACAMLTPTPSPVAPSHTGVIFHQLSTGEKYAVYIPRGQPPTTAWPCILFLNGSGECGTDGQRQLTQGLLPAILNAPDRWPFIAVFPQKPTSKETWLQHADLALSTLQDTQARYPVDPQRLYLTGLSQGGRGTFEIAAANPTLFAAIAPICGFGEPAPIAAGMGGTPVWAFHGQQDDIVPPDRTRDIINAIATASGQTPALIPRDDGQRSTLRLTIYPDLNHGSWDRAYRDSNLPDWLLRFSR